MNQTFQCAQCGDLLPASQLSRASLNRTGAKSKAAALRLLTPDSLICNECQHFLDEVGDPYADGENLGRTPTEAFEFSGVPVDPAQWQAHLLNY